MRIPSSIAAFALVLAASTVAIAGPLKVRSVGTDSQIITMCPECNAPLACAQVGDYTVGFSADLVNPKFGIATLGVRLTDKNGAPVTNAKVSATLSMPKHGHTTDPITFRHRGKGKYTGSTPRLRMEGVWEAEVSVKTAKGDTVSQKFSFVRSG